MDWLNSITPAIINALAPLIGAGIVALLGFLVKYVIERIRSVNNATVQMLAGIAVRFAETQFGPDTQSGALKEALAVDFLVTRIKGLDRAVATQFVKAAYQAVFTELATVPLPAGLASSSGSPSASATTSLAGN